DYLGQILPKVTTNELMQAMAAPNEQERLTGKEREGLPVHLMDIHLEKGMHCVDCHFNQDNHGNTKLYGEVRAAIEISCVDCHGTINRRAELRTSGPAAPEGGPNLPPGTDLTALRTPFGKRRFEVYHDKIIQNSMVEDGRWWEVVQTADTINPSSQHYN